MLSIINQKNYRLGMHFSTNKKIGATLIVAGTSIGAGMLAMPIASHNMGFIPSVILMFVMWLIAFSASLIVAKINIHFKKPVSIPLAAGKILGRKVGIFSAVAMLIMLYSLLVAYISGSTEIISAELAKLNIILPRKAIAIFLTLVLMLLLFYKTKAVDYTNRIMFVIKLALLSAVIITLLDDIKIDLLMHSGHINKILPTVIIFFTAFGFHLSIHAIVAYVGDYYFTLRKVFFFGTLIPLIIYVSWQITTLGIVPMQGTNSFGSIIASNYALSSFISALSYHANIVSLSPFVTWFSLFAIFTSLLGVSIGLFEYFMELNNYSPDDKGRLKSSIYTFIIPLILVIISPNIFVKALTVAGAFLSFLAIIIPSLILLKIKKVNIQEYKALKQNSTVLVVMIIIGCLFIIISFL